jgi:hypothetical protein
MIRLTYKIIFKGTSYSLIMHWVMKNIGPVNDKTKTGVTCHLLNKKPAWRRPGYVDLALSLVLPLIDGMTSGSCSVSLSPLPLSQMLGTMNRHVEVLSQNEWAWARYIRPRVNTDPASLLILWSWVQNLWGSSEAPGEVSFLLGFVIAALSPARKTKQRYQRPGLQLQAPHNTYLCFSPRLGFQLRG